jgi:hypothetical protein
MARRDALGRLRVSQADFDDWLGRELRRDPYARISVEVLLYGAPRLLKGEEYVIDPARPSEPNGA